MDKRLETIVEAIKKKARESAGSKASVTPLRNHSSLHKLIKTKEQAERFMRLLQSA